MSPPTEKTDIDQEFENIENKKLWKIVLMSLREESDKLTKNETFENARKVSNKSRNRYRDVLPYDSTRVKLSGFGLSDYINASYVNLDNNKYERRYILTQGPLLSTISHFWKMIWDENSECVVMLNKIIEKDTIKCAQYFPTTEKENENHIYADVNLSVSIVESKINKAYIKRTFTIQNEKTQESRKIFQFHYQSWPDFGVPSSSEQLLQFLWDIRASGGLDNPNKPAVIHCSAGIGRSGTFVLIDLSLLQIAEEQSCKSVKLQQMLVQLRKCRIGLIQTAEQLRFAYSSVISGAKVLLNAKNIDTSLIQFNDHWQNLDSESIHLSSSSQSEEDSDFSENSNSNSALDRVAAAVRTRRGLPPKNETGSFFVSQSNYNSQEHDIPNQDRFSSSTTCPTEQNRKMIREIRCNRTRKIIEDIRSNMRQQDLERERILCRFGINRLANSLLRHNRTSLIAGASAIVGVLSLACGYIVYKYVG